MRAWGPSRLSITSLERMSNLPKALTIIAQPVANRIWGLPAVLNFFLGGTAVGFYLLWSTVTPLRTAGVHAQTLAGLFAVLFALTGFGSLALEAGRPSRAPYLLFHLKTSWMSREVAAGFVFIAGALIYALTGSIPAEAITVIAGCMLLISQAMMVHSCSAVAVWRHAAVPPLFISSAIASGYGVILVMRSGLILSDFSSSPTGEAVAAVGLVINCLAWIAILKGNYAPELRQSIRRLKQPAKLVIVIGLGQVLPLAVLFFFNPWSGKADAAVDHPQIMLFAGLAAFAGGGMQKFWFIRSMQHICGIQLESGADKNIG